MLNSQNKKKQQQKPQKIIFFKIQPLTCLEQEQIINLQTDCHFYQNNQMKKSSQKKETQIEEEHKQLFTSQTQQYQYKFTIDPQQNTIQNSNIFNYLNQVSNHHPHNHKNQSECTIDIFRKNNHPSIFTDTISEKSMPLSLSLSFFSYSFSRIKKHRNYLDDYLFLANLGKGAFGKVSKLKNKKTGSLYAAKILHKSVNSTMTNLRNQKFKKEIQIYEKLCHPNIANLKHVYFYKNQFTLIMDYFQGKNLHYLHRQTQNQCHQGFEDAFKNTPEQKIAKIIFQIICTLEYIHSMNIVHHDIKPQNILFQPKDHKIKIVDFGEAIKLQEPIQIIEEQGGTYAYFSPELFKHQCSTKVDIWACGMVLFYLLCGRLMFYDKDHVKMRKNILTDEVKFVDYLWADRSAQVKYLIKKMLEKDPKKRLTAKEIKESEWLKKYNFTSIQPDISGATIQQTTMRFSPLQQTSILARGKSSTKIINESKFKLEKKRADTVIKEKENKFPSN